MVKQFKGTREDFEHGPVEAGEDSVDDDRREYSIEDITDSKVENGKIFYLVKW